MFHVWFVPVRFLGWNFTDQEITDLCCHSQGRHFPIWGVTFGMLDNMLCHEVQENLESKKHLPIFLCCRCSAQLDVTYLHRFWLSSWFSEPENRKVCHLLFNNCPDIWRDQWMSSTSVKTGKSLLSCSSPWWEIRKWGLAHSIHFLT